MTTFHVILPQEFPHATVFKDAHAQRACASFKCEQQALKSRCGSYFFLNRKPRWHVGLLGEQGIESIHAHFNAYIRTNKNIRGRPTALLDEGASHLYCSCNINGPNKWTIFILESLGQHTLQLRSFCFLIIIGNT